MTRELSRLRNLGIMAHIDAGKTTVSERILFLGGRTHRPGDIDDQTTTLDASEISKRMGITIAAAATSVGWRPLSGAQAGVPHRLNLIDTPGHVDFTIEVERSLRVLDGAVAVFDASQGVEPQSETVWRQADRYGVARIAFVNKMDKVGADFDACVASLRERLGARAVPVQLPVGQAGEFLGVVDLLRMRAYLYDQDALGQRFSEAEVPEPLRAKAAEARRALVEACADFDDEVMRRFLEGEEVGAEALERALRRGTLQRGLVPVLCGAAFRNKGVQMLLDAVVSYLPSPADLPAVVGRTARGEEVRYEPNDDAPACALAFKLVVDKAAGALTYLRVYSGTIRAGAQLVCARTGRSERLGRLVRMHVDAREPVAEARAGDIVAAVGLGEVRTGDTLADPRAVAALEAIALPEPVLELAVQPVTNADQDRLAGALRKLALEDPSFRVRSDPESGEVRIQGMGELHLDIVVQRLKSDHGVSARTGAPQVAYRETVAREAAATYRHVKQDGGPGQFAVVALRIAPRERGSGVSFRDGSRGGSVPREFVPAVEEGVRGALARGLLAGFPVVDVEVELLDGAAHAKDSSAVAFEIAGSLAVQQAAKEAGVHLLEPVMAVEAEVPEESLGAVLGDLQSRRGQVLALDRRGRAQLVRGLVPLAETFGYVGHLRGLCHGRANAQLSLAHYAPVPPALQAGVLARVSR